MKVLSGHLTATNKKAIKAIIKAGLEAGKVGRIAYYLFLNDGIYTVKTVQNDRGMGFCGEPLRESTYTSTFTM